MDNNNEWEMNPAIFELFLLYYYMRGIINYFAKASLVYYLGTIPRVLHSHICAHLGENRQPLLLTYSMALIPI